MTLAWPLVNDSFSARWLTPSRLPALMVLPANALMLLAGLEGGRPAFLVGGLLGVLGCLSIIRWSDCKTAHAPSLLHSFLPWHDAWRFSGTLSLLNGVCFGLSGLNYARVDELLISACTLIAAALLLLPERKHGPQPHFNRLALRRVYDVLTARPTRASALAYGLASTTILVGGLWGADLARAFSGAWFLTASALQARTSKLYAAP